MELKTRFKAGFGNGTRAAGFVFATIELGEGEELQEVIEACSLLSNGKSDEWPKSVNFAESVTKQEVISAFRSLNRTTELAMPEAETADASAAVVDWSKIKIEELELSPKLLEALQRANVVVVADLEEFDDVKTIDGIGAAMATELEQKIRAFAG